MTETTRSPPETYKHVHVQFLNIRHAPAIERVGVPPSAIEYAGRDAEINFANRVER